MTPAGRMALQYVLLFGATGVSLPFAGLWMGAQGFTGSQIGLLLAAPMLARVVTGPAIAVWADGFRRRRTPIAILAGVAALTYGGAGWVEGVWLQGVLWFVAASASAGLIPLTDVLALALARRWGFAFSRARSCGSAAFVVANVAMGLILARASVEWVIVWVTVASGLMALVAAVALPDRPLEPARVLPSRQRFAGLTRLLSDDRFLTALLAIGCIQATHAFHYGFSALVWKGQGLSETTTGVLWAFSVVVEIAFMWSVEPWRRRAGIGARTLLMLGGMAAVVRWTAMAFAPPLWALWPLQALHALTFAATYLAGVELIERLSPDGQHTAAQTLNSVMAAGLLMGAATLASGPLYDLAGLLGYLGMAGLAALGLLAGLRLGHLGAD